MEANEIIVKMIESYKVNLSTESVIREFTPILNRWKTSCILGKSYNSILDQEMKIDITEIEILEIVSKVTGICINRLTSRNQTRNLVEPRMLFYFLVRKYTSCTLKDLGKIVSRDHTTILNGIVNHHNYSSIPNCMEYHRIYFENLSKMESEIKKLILTKKESINEDENTRDFQQC